jgi:hypothetical protein
VVRATTRSTSKEICELVAEEEEEEEDAELLEEEDELGRLSPHVSHCISEELFSKVQARQLQVRDFYKEVRILRNRRENKARKRRETSSVISSTSASFGRCFLREFSSCSSFNLRLPSRFYDEKKQKKEEMTERNENCKEEVKEK